MDLLILEGIREIFRYGEKEEGISFKKADKNQFNHLTKNVNKSV